MAFEKHIEEHEQRRAKALAMGGPEKLARRRAEGILNARERVEYLLDSQSWEETGLFGTSILPEMRDETPADGKVAGFGRIQGREVGVASFDFTVKGSSSSTTNEKKIAHIKDVAKRRGLPLVFLGESTGARMPDIMGATGMAGLGGPTRFLRMRETPWAAAVLGHAYGSAAWHACVSDFMVMRKGAIMAVSSPRLVEMATRGQVDPEALGGWKLHAEITGFADQVVETDAAALDAIKQFLSYLP
ncbi:MAG: carboxyl transferase domain-containing protein, partial [Ktedonobacteraceae bacterium]